MSQSLSPSEERIVAEEKRAQRAEDEHMTYFLIGGTDHVVEGDSGNRHVLSVDGAEATDCSCPDHQQRGIRCKHMAAYDEWSFDVIEMSCGITVEL